MLLLREVAITWRDAITLSRARIRDICFNGDMAIDDGALLRELRRYALMVDKR